MVAMATPRMYRTTRSGHECWRPSPHAHPAPEPVLPYPHARNDCIICREADPDFEIVQEALQPSDWTGREPRRFCQRCVGRWIATMAMSRPGDVSPGCTAGRDRHPAAPRQGIVVTSAALPEGPLKGSLGENPLAAEPTASTSALIGYARVSTGSQRLDRQPSPRRAASESSPTR
jgi:hypothetical protein